MGAEQSGNVRDKREMGTYARTEIVFLGGRGGGGKSKPKKVLK